jgi:adenine/guanine phosphoribosyltransferase-like PRPP-binding protein
VQAAIPIPRQQIQTITVITRTGTIAHCDMQINKLKQTIEEHNIHKLVHFESKGIPLSFKSSTRINPIVPSSPVQKKEVLVKGLELATRAVQTA